MIPEIGVMIGLYILTRMLVLVIDKAQAGSVRIFAAITLIVSALVMADLLVRGTATAGQMERLLQ
jgi:hypothetical protein